MGKSSPGSEGEENVVTCEEEKLQGVSRDDGLLKINSRGEDLPDETDALPENLNYGCFDLLCTLVSMLTYLFDLIMDCMVAFYFYHLAVQHGIYHYWYFGLTLSFIILPSLTMTGFSLRWYLVDADNPCLPEVSMKTWILRLLCLMFQFAPILRYVDSIRYGLQSRKAAQKEKALESDPIAKKHAAEKKRKYYTLMVYEDADATLLRLFESFMESAPQLVLQIYILIKDPEATNLSEEHVVAGDEIADSLIKSTILVLSVISSLISLAWSLVVYHRSLRYTYPEKNNLDWRGSVFQFLWHFTSITARVIALSLFATVHAEGIGLVCGVHWVIMSAWVIYQRTHACNTRCEEFLFSLVLGAIYIFSFFNAKDERTRWKYVIYYGFCFCENTALVVTWIVTINQSPNGTDQWFFYPAVVGHYLTFFLGLTFMSTYYYWFHPSDIKPIKLSLGKKRHRPFVMRTKKDSLLFKNLRRISNTFHKKPNGEAAVEQGNADQAEGEEDAVELKPLRPNKLTINTNVNEREVPELSPSVSSPVLDQLDSPGVQVPDAANRCLRSSSVPAGAKPPFKPLIIRSFKFMGSSGIMIDESDHI